MKGSREQRRPKELRETVWVEGFERERGVEGDRGTEGDCEGRRH